MFESPFDTEIREKLRSHIKAIREKGLELLLAVYSEEMIRYLLEYYKKERNSRMQSEVGVVWVETCMVVWDKAGPDGDIRPSGPLWPYLTKIAENIGKTEKRKLTRWPLPLDSFISDPVLKVPDPTRFDSAHDKDENLKCHYKMFSRPEVWILESKAGINLPPGEFEDKQKGKRKVSAWGVATYWYNRRVYEYNRHVEECNQTVAEYNHTLDECDLVLEERNRRVDEYNRMVDKSESQGHKKEKYIDVKEAKLIYTRALRRLRRIVNVKGEI